MIRTALVAGTLSLSLAACSSPGSTGDPPPAITAAPTSALPTGTPAGSAAAASSAPAPPRATISGRDAIDTADGFAITLPKGYYGITAKTTVADLEVEGAPNYANLATVLKSEQALVPASVVFFAADLADVPKVGFADNINLNVESAGGAAPASVGDSYDELAPLLSKVNATPIAHATGTAAGQPALRIDYTLPEGEAIVYGTQIYLIKNDTVFITTVSLAAPDDAVVKAVVAGMHFTS